MQVTYRFLMYHFFGQARCWVSLVSKPHPYLKFRWNIVKECTFCPQSQVKHQEITKLTEFSIIYSAFSIFQTYYHFYWDSLLSRDQNQVRGKRILWSTGDAGQKANCSAWRTSILDRERGQANCDAESWFTLGLVLAAALYGVWSTYCIVDELLRSRAT